MDKSLRHAAESLRKGGAGIVAVAHPEGFTDEAVWALAALVDTVLVHGALFVLGFTLVFVMLGASATLLGSLFAYASRWVERIGGTLLIVFGLYPLGLIRIPGAAREWPV